MPDMGYTLEVVRFNRPEDKNGAVKARACFKG
jgi:hypothetical protein